MDYRTAHSPIKLGLPPLEIFQLPFSQPPKTVPHVPQPPSNISAEVLFRPVIIDPAIFHISHDLPTVLTFTAIYIAAVIFLNQYNASRQHRPWAFSKKPMFKVLVLAHNTLIALFSAWTFCGLLYLTNSGWPSAVGGEESNYYAGVAEYLCETESSAYRVLIRSKSLWEGGGSYIGWLFYMSKFYEVVDTLIILSRGKTSSTLQTYHHVGVIICSYVALEYESPLAFVGIILNSGIHTLMYSYFAIQTLGVPISLSFKRTLTSLQIAQFVVGLVWASSYLFVSYRVQSTGKRIQNALEPPSDCSASLEHPSVVADGMARMVANESAIPCLSGSGDAFPLILAALYLLPLIFLFVQFYIKSYRKKIE
ncbi:uncharacterized protein N7482_008505 [Penicillium canariense]|uniref:Elongation of fatty acids protein n=1 Tax=Penicillium canariense TaxID=189055 RepID=A0A9W9LJ22_9EURO|nr:uncharacterized protein N7482_008505 [Penicillium canariense]KAJ5157405.1 hypothetical protein N7482_008505 [Penicillium canariense]